MSLPPFHSTAEAFMKIEGKVVEEFGFFSMEVSSLKKLDVIEDPRYSEMDTSTRGKHSSNLSNTEEDQQNMKSRRDQLEKLT